MNLKFLEVLLFLKRNVGHLGRTLFDDSRDRDWADWTSLLMVAWGSTKVSTT